MRRRPSRRVLRGVIAVVAAVSATAGCSAGNRAGAGAAASQPAATAVPPGVVGVTPAGITTMINIPARSTEDEYFQACHAARQWMQGRNGDRQTLIEAYLAAVQAPKTGSPGTWNTAWAALSLPRQAAVIVAAKAAANDECG